MKFSFLTISFLLLFNSCQKDKNFNDNLNESTEISLKENGLEKFSIILSKAVMNNSDLRKFIKDEALKQKDNDYDVIYGLCKNEIVSGRKTFKEILENYEGTKGEVDSLENVLPTITILVPTLPNDFNAETWSPKDQIPVIAHEKTKSVELYLDGKKEISLKRDQIPGFPTLVVKENERLRVNGPSLKSSLKGQENNLVFAHEAFDGINNNHQTTKNIPSKKLKASSVGGRGLDIKDKFYFEVSQKLTDAYNKFIPRDGGWQRDHIYYNLDNVPNAKGRLDQTFTESIMAIKIEPAALSIMMDQNDPRYNTNYTWHSKSGHLPTKNIWTDGKFEIQIDIITSDIDGGGAATSRVLSVHPLELFDVNYTEQIIGRPTSGDYSVIYTFKDIKSKFYYCNLPIKEWNLEKMGYTWKFSVRENDDNTVYTDSETVTAKYATNFSFEPGGLFKEKLGLKFGGSAEKSESNTSSVQRTLSNDFLGEAYANFGDAILKTGTKFDIGDTEYNIVDLKSAFYRKSAVEYINFVRVNSGREPVPYPNWFDEQKAIRSSATNVYQISNFNTILNNNFEILMLPVYKY
ncbi:hypothetical protein [Sphingobacterium anhuiense]|uniref:Lipoprotein n=1 Tax=Sphingobacterium anhuiense TaxID=493780 RepID=A0ABW5YZ56_9SPHI